MLNEAYSAAHFRQVGHDLIDLMADYLEMAENQTLETVIPYASPNDNLAYWQNDLATTTPSVSTLPTFFRDVVARSTHLHHPRCVGHQVSPPLPVSALSSVLTSVLNNGMAVYEMGLVSNPLEKIVTDWVAQRCGYDDSAMGLLTSGGTLANLTALLAARAAMTDVWANGTSEKLAVMVSEEAHYCVDRAARIMGLGTEGVIKIPANAAYQMRTDLLEAHMQTAADKGLRVFAVVGSACSTSTGAYDDLEAIADFCAKHQLWFHVDGAHGAAAIFSEKYRHLVAGLSRADSMILDFHKMLMVPALVTAVVFKRGSDSFNTFQQKAQYLWSSQDADWFTSGKRTFECTKLMMSVKVYTILKAYGEQIFTENVDKLYDLGQIFAQMIDARPRFERAHDPQSNIVCFRFVPNGTLSDAELSTLNAQIRTRLVEKGHFYIVQTTLRDRIFLRVSLMNPLTTEGDLSALLDAVEASLDG